MKRFRVVRWTVMSVLALLPLMLPVSAYADVATLTAPVRVEDDDRRVVFSRKWTYVWDQAASGWSQEVSSLNGSTAKLVFNGTGAAFVAPLRTDGGYARIAVDGSAVATVSLYASIPAASAPVWSVVGLVPGVHTVTVTALGSREGSSTGSVVAVDAFDVEGTLLDGGSKGTLVHQGDSRLYRKGTWHGRTSGYPIRRTAMYSYSTNAAVTVRFKGTGVIWIGRKSPNAGLAAVYLDGTRVAVVGGKPDSAVDRHISYSVTGLRWGTHKLMIRPLGNPSVTGGGTSVDVDAFVVYGTPIYCYRPTPFKYPWSTYIVIDKSDYRLYWVKDKMLVKTYPIAHGKYNCTPTRVWRIDAKYYTSPGSVYGPRKMRLFKRVDGRFIYTAYAIHGTNQPWVIGTQASHGCIRMYNRDVLDLFPRVRTGTMVVTRA